MRPELSVVIVARNEAARLPALLADLAPAAARIREIVVVDGASRDGTAALSRLAGARVVAAAPSRGGQLAAGVAATDGAWLLLLHADTRLPQDWIKVVGRAQAVGLEKAWAFRLGIEASGAELRLVEALVALRSRCWNLPYGDQGLLISRHLLKAVGGIAPIPLMEDLELVLRLRRRGGIGLLPATLLVSGRRWQRLGVVGTALANGRLRRAWRRGERPEQLAARYNGDGRDGGLAGGGA
jgi:rSAM/selenodomain-associated transferase 2